MIQENWEEVRTEDSPTLQDEALQALLARKLEDALPAKTVRLRNTDKPYITKEIKVINRRLMREYVRHGKSLKYLSLKNTYDRKIKTASQTFLNRNVRALMEAEPGKAYSTLKRLSAAPGDRDAGSFEVTEHLDLGLTAVEAADRIAQKFADISQEYPALRLEELPTRVVQNIQNSKNVVKPHISKQLVEKKIKEPKIQKVG